MTIHTWNRRGSLTIFAFAAIPGAAYAAPFAQKEKLKKVLTLTQCEGL